MRLIDADALIAEYCEDCEAYLHKVCDRDVCGTVLMLAEAPTIDAVPVVRCKDCVHWYGRDGVCLKIYDDGSVSPYAWQFRNEDDFCSYGERKSDG